jgi:hypothetical protein
MIQFAGRKKRASIPSNADIEYLRNRGNQKAAVSSQPSALSDEIGSELSTVGSGA